MSPIAKLIELKAKVDRGDVSKPEASMVLAEVIEELKLDEAETTLLDKFAMAAPGIEPDVSTGYVAGILGITADEYASDGTRYYFEADAMLRYQWAEAMMKIRKCYPSNYKREQ